MKKIFFTFFLLGTMFEQGTAQLTVTQLPTGFPLNGTIANSINAWYRGGNLPVPNTSNIFGTFWNSEVHHYTNGIWRHTTTTGNGLNNSGFNSSIALNGDGISIRNNGTGSSAFASIDLFTAFSNTTALRMGRSFLIQTANSRTEQIGNYNGFWYNVTNVYPGFIPQYIWNINQTEYGRLGSNLKWRFGPNPTSANANNRVEIKSATTDPYFGSVNGCSGLRLSNLLPANTPVANGTNGVNASKVLTVDGNGDVVLTTPLSAVTANNGLQVNALGAVQLGGACSSPTEVANAALMSDRKIQLKTQNILFFQSSSSGGLSPGRIGIGDFIGCAIPGNLLEVTKTASGPGNPFGLSGLRLGDLRAGAFVNAPNGQSLSVDANGDVILVQNPAGGGVTLCGPAPVNNVVKVNGPNSICQTNITDMFPLGTVGINNTTPNDALDVNNGGGSTGDVDVMNPVSAYQINDQDMLLHKGVVNNLYIGVGAGALTPTGPGNGLNNTVIGHIAHGSNALNVTEEKNVVLGSAAAELVGGANGGINNDVYIGYRAGRSADGVNNTYVGSEAGANNIPGADENTFIGWHAGMNNGGLHNVLVGNMSGLNNQGFQNCFVGIGSGLQNNTGSFNVSLGGGSGPGVGFGAITNTIAIGDGAMTTGSNTMILGDNAINVGIGLSGNVLFPQNKMEINTTTGFPYFGSPNGSSGLRFRNMTNANTPLNVTFNGVLSVDNNGDVILVQDKTGSSGSGVGNYCSAAPNPLAGNYSVPLNSNDYHFLDDASYTDKVNVGYTSCVTTPGKLNATTSFPTTVGTNNSVTIHGTNFNSINGSTNTGVYGEVSSLGISTDAYGVWGNAAASTRNNYGVYGQGGNAGAVSHGGYFQATVNTNQANVGLHAEGVDATLLNVGVDGLARGCLYARGGDFTAFALTCNLENIGVSGRAFPNLGSLIPTYPVSVNVGVYGQVPNVIPVSPDYAGFFDGNVWINGPASGTGYAVTSDARLKTGVKGLKNSMELIMKLKPSTYMYDTKNKYGIHFSEGKQYGFIAQELEEVIPEIVMETYKPAMIDDKGIVHSDSLHFKAVNYDAIIPVVVSGIQEQQEDIRKIREELDIQKKLNSNLQARMEKLEALLMQMGENKSNNDVLLPNEKNTIVLEQNVPNPFSQKTTIGYVIPSTAKEAYIHFYTSDGKLIRTAVLSEKGKGELTVFASDLSSGNYTYSLFMDGNMIETKRMTIR